MPASTIKTEEEKSAPEPVTLTLLLLLFEEVKGSNTKMLCSLFMFRGKVLEVKREDFESDGFMSLKDVIVTGFPQKCRARKTSKKSFKKKLKIGPVKPLASGGANRQKGKAAIITETNKEEIIRKPQLK